ncbi:MULTISPECIES: SAM-dependent methyltransferase [Cysteiniphilum]|uniref:Methylase n=1 Tax=Cysteiniphilum litorale TaxID=2056700 RepID=A0A8J3E8X2_9GAMM|nr:MULTISPECIES: SAM-dependent methyltransferase [Cysteiniphilum]GGF99063.1 methylase [Cysteiniphilum litorale]
MKNLVIVGTGIKYFAHLTHEAVGYIKNSDIVLYLANEPLIEEYIEEEAQKCFNLSKLYFSGKPRQESYDNITSFVINTFKSYNNVCFAVYGHPTFCIDSTINTAMKSKDLDIKVTICPAISSLDCMFCDLMIDPCTLGYSVYEASSFIEKKPNINKNGYLILLQVGFIGNLNEIDYHNNNKKKLLELQEVLINAYGSNNLCYFYEASLYPSIEPISEKTTLENMNKCLTTSLSSLIIFPLEIS